MEVIGQEFRFKAQARMKRCNAKNCVRCNIINNKYNHKIYLGFVGLSSICCTLIKCNNEQGFIF